MICINWSVGPHDGSTTDPGCFCFLGMASVRSFEAMLPYGTYTRCPLATHRAEHGRAPAVEFIHSMEGPSILCYSVSDSSASDTCDYECSHYWGGAVPAQTCA